MRKREWDNAARHRRRLLQTIARREQQALPAPRREWFSERMWRTIHLLTADGLVRHDARGVRLTAAGRRFLSKKARNVTPLRASERELHE